MNVITRAMFASMLMSAAGASFAASPANCDAARERVEANMRAVDVDDDDLVVAVYGLAWRCGVAAAVAVAEQALSRPDIRDEFLEAWIDIVFARPEAMALHLAGIDASARSLRSAATAVDRASLGILAVTEKALPAVMAASQASDDPDNAPDAEEIAQEIADFEALIASSRLSSALRLGEIEVARGAANRIDALLKAQDEAEGVSDAGVSEEPPMSTMEVVDAFLTGEGSEGGFHLDTEWTVEVNRFRCGTMAFFAPKVAHADKLRLDGNLDAAVRSWLRATRGGLDDGADHSEAIYLVLRERHGDRHALHVAWAAAEASIWHDGRRAGWTLFGEALPLPTARRDFRNSEPEQEAELMTQEALIDFVRASALYRLIHSP